MNKLLLMILMLVSFTSIAEVSISDKYSEAADFCYEKGFIDYKGRYAVKAYGDSILGIRRYPKITVDRHKDAEAFCWAIAYGSDARANSVSEANEELEWRKREVIRIKLLGERRNAKKKLTDERDDIHARIKELRRYENSKGPLLHYLIVIRKVEMNLILARMNNQFIVLSDELGVIDQAGPYRIELDMSSDAVYTVTDVSGFERDIPLYRTTREGREEYKRWLNGPEAKSVSEEKDTLNKRLLEIKRELKEL